MAKTLRTLTRSGWATKGAVLTAEEVDDTLLELEDDILAAMPIYVTILAPKATPVPPGWAVADGAHTVNAATPASLASLSPNADYEWRIKLV